MQVLVKITVTLSQPTDRDSANTILTKHGFTPVWYIVLGDVCATMLFSMNTELYENEYSTAFFEMLGVDGETLKSLTDKVDVGLIPLDFNCPATVTQTINGNVTTTVSQQSYTEGEGTWTYTTTGTFNTSTGTNTLTSSATYSDEKVTQTTVMNVDPETGEGVITTTTTNNETGQVTEQSNYYDENGELTNTHIEKTNTDNSHQSTDIVYGDDGSSELHSTQYDSNDNPTEGTNQWVDPLGNQNTQTLEYDSNGDPEVVGYNIDTSGNTNGTGETLEESINTGFIAFDGKSFEITADFEFACNDLGTTYFKTLLSALETASNGTYNGFYIRNGGIDSSITTSNRHKFTFYARSNSGITIDPNGNGRGDGYTFGSTCYLRKIKGRYQMTVTYTPGSNAGSFTATIKPTYSNGDNSPTAAGTTINASNNSSIPPRMDNAQIILGGNGVSHNFDIVNMTVYSFNVRKTS